MKPSSRPTTVARTLPYPKRALLSVLLCSATFVACQDDAPESQVFEGHAGTRFYATPAGLDSDEALRQPLIKERYAITAETDPSELKLKGKFPYDTLSKDCPDRLEEGPEGVPQVRLYDAKGKAVARWSADDKITLTYDLKVESSMRLANRGETGSSLRVGRRIGVVQTLTPGQMKDALNWFAAEPCADPGDPQ